MPDQNYARTMAKLPDEGLVRIAFAEAVEGYAPDAVDAAKEELRRRGLSDDAARHLAENDGYESLAKVDPRTVALSDRAWLALVIGAPLFAIMLVIVGIMFFAGYTKWSRQALLAILTGVVGWNILIGAVIAIIVLLY